MTADQLCQKTDEEQRAYWNSTRVVVNVETAETARLELDLAQKLIDAGRYRAADAEEIRRAGWCYYEKPYQKTVALMTVPKSQDEKSTIVIVPTHLGEALTTVGTHRVLDAGELEHAMVDVQNRLQREEPLKQALREVETELRYATKQFGPFHSAHEAYGVLAEEFREFEEQVFMKHRSKPAMRSEACQISAMALRVMLDLC